MRHYYFHFTSTPQSLANDNTNPRCSQHNFQGRCIYGPDSVSLSDGIKSLFTDSDFIRSHSSQFGGAIDQSNGDLTIQRCIFDTCSAVKRGGAVSFRSAGNCVQEDNLYAHCSGGASCGAFSSHWEGHYPHHHQQRCMYIDNHSGDYYGHSSIEYSPETVISSNFYIHGYSTGSETWSAGTVVNFHERGSIIYSNCVFAYGKAFNGGGLSLLGEYTTSNAYLSVQCCFFINNDNTNGSPYELYFDQHTSKGSNRNHIILSFSATANGCVFSWNESPQNQNWLPQG